MLKLKQAASEGAELQPRRNPPQQGGALTPLGILPMSIDLKITHTHESGMLAHPSKSSKKCVILSGAQPKKLLWPSRLDFHSESLRTARVIPPPQAPTARTTKRQRRAPYQHGAQPHEIVAHLP